MKPQFGGSYGGRGFRNAVVGLGDGRFLEIMGPEPEGWDKDDHLSPPQPEIPKAPPPLQITPLDWMIVTQDLSALRSKLQRRGFDVPPVFGRDSFIGPWPDEWSSAWDSFQVYDISSEVSPYLIQWNRGTRLPSRNAPRGCTLHRLVIRAPQTTKLRQLVTILRLGAHVAHGAKPRLAVTLNCPKGRISF